MRAFQFFLIVALALFVGTWTAFAQDLENGRRLSQRWCSQCHAIGLDSSKYRGIPSFESIAAKENINADMIASFLLLPHATMPNMPLSHKDARDIAAFIIEMKK